MFPTLSKHLTDTIMRKTPPPPCVCRCVCVHAYRGQLCNFGYLSSLAIDLDSFFFFLKTILVIGLTFTKQVYVGWLARPRDPCTSRLPRSAFIVTRHHAQLFMWVLRTQTQSSCLFDHVSSSPSPLMKSVL